MDEPAVKKRRAPVPLLIGAFRAGHDAFHRPRDPWYGPPVLGAGPRGRLRKKFTSTMNRPLLQGLQPRARTGLRAALIVAGVAVAVGSLAALTVSAGATPGGDVLGAKRGAVRILEAEVQRIDAQASAAADAHAAAVRRADELHAQIAASERGLAETRRDRAIALERLSKRIVGLYTQQSPTLVEVVLSSGDLSTVADTQDVLEAVSQQDQGMLDRIRTTRQRLTRLHAELEGDREAVEAAVTESAARMNRLQGLIAGRRSVLAEAQAGLDRLVARRGAARAAAAEATAERALLRRADPATAPAPSPAAAAPAADPAPRPAAAPSGDVSAALERIAQCESGGNPQAVSAGGQYRGKYQFDLGTWQSLGGSGDPAAASEEEQDRIAAVLYARSGPAPWPVCGYR